MQSAAKCPILVAFKIHVRQDVHPGFADGEVEAAGSQGSGKEDEEPETRACIFKVGDDCRQDILALQVNAREGGSQCWHNAWRPAGYIEIDLGIGLFGMGGLMQHLPVQHPSTTAIINPASLHHPHKGDWPTQKGLPDGGSGPVPVAVWGHRHRL